MCVVEEENFRLEANERIKIARKLINTAKKLSVEAKAEQIKARGSATVPVVSQNALELMEKEAKRVGHMLQLDSNSLKSAEMVLHDLNNNKENPLSSLRSKIETVERNLANFT